MRNSDKFAKEFVMDRPIVSMFSFPSYTTTDTFVGLVPGTGHPVLTNINSSGCPGLVLNADSEGYSWLWREPIDLDQAQVIRFRFYGSNSEATSASKYFTCTMSYTELVAGTTAVAAAGTALTASAETYAVGANVFQNTPWISMAASTLSGTPGDDSIICKMVVDVTTIADFSLLGGEAQYYRAYVG
jgi:hypothetical protein